MFNVTGQLAFKILSIPMLYSAVVITGIVTTASLTLTESIQRIYDRRGSSFEYDITEMTFLSAYVFLITVPCVRLLEYGRVTRFINDWGNLQVTTVIWKGSKKYILYSGWNEEQVTVRKRLATIQL
jgi:hypothetical protein